MGAERITAMFAETRSEGRAAFLPFMTAGLPDPRSSHLMFEAMARAGADGFEVGVPYSDPLMDGPVVQRGSDMAIRAGATLDVALSILGEVVAGTGRPTMAMTYANPVFRRGVDAFCERLVEVGADAIIVPDLPVEESGSLRQAAARHGLGVVLFVAPTSNRSRIESVVAAEPVFIYAVAEMGVTGERSESSGRAVALIESIRAVTDIPVVFGVGISTPQQAATVAKTGADGVIVGSALVRLALEAESAEAAVSALSDAVRAVAGALTVA